MIFRRIKFLVGVFSFFSLFFFSGLISAQVEGVIQQLVENGNAQTGFKTPGLTFKLFCPGNVECGSVTYSNLKVTPSDPSQAKLNLTSDLLITVGNSRLTAQNCSFVANSMSGNLNALDPSSGNIPYAMFLTQCNPLPTNGATGNFANAGLLSYRGLMEFNGLNLALSRSSAYVISTGSH